MIIGVLRDPDPGERRVAATPATVEQLAKLGYQVVVEPGAGAAASFSDEAYAESMRTPPRTLLEIDVDTRDPESGARLLRYKTTRYLPYEQRAEIRFLYDKFEGDTRKDVDRYVSDFDCHVYYPREVELLFRLTGFEVEARYGSYDMRRPSALSRQMIVIGRRP